LEKVKKSKKFTLNLQKPEAPVVDVKFEGFPAKGKDGAKVTIIEFADYQCPHCKVASESFKKVTEKFKDKVKFVYLDFPVNPSGISKVVAEGSHCAEEQGKFWDYHYKAFEGQATLDKDSPTKLAKELKLDEAKFKACLEGTKGKALVEKARSEGERIGVSGTPYLLINGRRYMGAHTVEAITKEIETSLK
jgi:protein-disulfide isomerase